MKKNPTILLTFDVEEFDLPMEYNIPISTQLQMEIGKLGADEMKRIIEAQNIPTTLFTTANFAENYPAFVKEMAQQHEIGSHAFYHSSFERKDLLNSKIALEKITEKSVSGLRMPRFKKVDLEWVKEAGYTYDSSINPTYMPGRYNNLKVSRTVFYEQNLLRLPVSVTPNFRFPLFWMAFKNIPYPIYKKMALDTLKKDGYLSLYFHPWEFTDISTWKLPFYLKKHSAGRLSENLIRLIEDLKKEAVFETASNFLTGYVTSHE
jgi:peptidoglycan/xylan/chitin deacetylase (PgdA/CDA1 family)